jgi:predicted ATPase
VRHLQRLYDDLVAAQNNKPGLLGKLFGKKEQTPVKGLYFWGGVGAARPTWSTPSSRRCRSSRRCARTSTAS